jgi:steroid 5-alpha reductase family enzyme
MSAPASRFRSILISIVAYVLATIVAVLSWHLTPDLPDLARLAVADLAATLFIFGTSVAFNNSSMYDPYWSVKPAVIAMGAALTFGAGSTGSMALLVLMVLYGLRLTVNFYRDWPGLHHEDWRYVEFRQKFPKGYWAVSLFGIHLFPTVQVYLACLPVFLGMRISGEVGLLSIIGIWVTLFAIWLAYEADAQMRSFRSNPLNKGRIMDRGLWKHSRHPNYLGEILTWWGVWLIVIGMDPSLWWTGIGALSINIMFHFVSIPMMDRRSASRRPEFAQHIKRTNALLPFPKAGAQR